MKMRFIYEITDDETGKKVLITCEEKQGYEFKAARMIQDLINVHYDGKASYRMIRKERME